MTFRKGYAHATRLFQSHIYIIIIIIIIYYIYKARLLAHIYKTRFRMWLLPWVNVIFYMIVLAFA